MEDVWGTGVGKADLTIAGYRYQPAQVSRWSFRFTPCTRSTASLYHNEAFAFGLYNAEVIETIALV
jgi:hypothetical protein